MNYKFPDGILAQHVAVLGKTGSGKTSTAKLMVEQVVAGEARVCILDPIKSDWWGMTSSADGRRAGLPFQILGGPRGHVPLHSSSGKAIGEIVANGALPLSIMDMAEFEPGGQAKFFVDFAPTLIRKMRGVVYLVMEEAHLFAPKERSGIGAENMSIHWAKTMATAGRSKGIRLILVTQRTQALHNALLGSCDTMIAHRMTAPADQEPVVKWLKANTDKATTETVAGSLSSLPTGSGWLCSGEEKLFELIKFPRIRTYDNSATPTGDDDAGEIKTAQVDADKLRSIIGEAVKVAEANDPVALKKRIAELERQAKAAPAPPSLDKNKADLERAYETGFAAGQESITDQLEVFYGLLERWAKNMPPAPSFKTKPGDVPAQLQRHSSPVLDPVLTGYKSGSGGDGFTSDEHFRSEVMPAVDRGDTSQKLLNAIAELEQLGARSPPRELLAFMAGYSHVNSKGFADAMSQLRKSGSIEGTSLTPKGRGEANPPARPRTAAELQDRIIAMLGGASARVLRPLIDAYPDPIERKDLAEAAGFGHVNSKGFADAISRFKTLGFIDSPRTGAIAAKPLLFLQ